MSTTLNNSIKYNFIIRTFIQVLYEFRTRKAFDLLRINDFDLSAPKVTSKTKTVTIITCSAARNVIITAYLIIIRSVAVENDSSINRMSSLKVIIFVKSSTFAEEIIFFIKKITSRQSITFTKTTVVTRIAVMNKYRSFHIDVKDVIVFASLKMKEIYNIRY